MAKVLVRAHLMRLCALFALVWYIEFKAGGINAVNMLSQFLYGKSVIVSQTILTTLSNSARVANFIRLHFKPFCLRTVFNYLLGM